MAPRTQEWWFQLVEEGTGCAFANTEPDMIELPQALIRVRDLRNKIHAEYDHTKPPGRNLLAHVAPNQLKVYRDEAAYKAKKQCSPRSPLNELDAQATLIVVVPARQISDADMQAEVPPSGFGRQALQQDVVWYGVRGSTGMLQSVDLQDERTLSRSSLTNVVINRLIEKHVLLVKSPPMTGKSSLAALVSRDLVNRSKEQKQKVVVASFSLLAISDDETFHDVFKQECKVEWSRVKSLPLNGYTVYLVVDEAQVLYKTGATSPRRKSAEFWQLVKRVLNNKDTGIRVLMFAAYGSDLQYTQLSTPVEIPPEVTLGIEHLNFGIDEIDEYVTKWFRGFMCLQGSTTQFFALLALLTGGHVGLCVTAIRTLNGVYRSRVASGGVLPSAQEWIGMLEHGSMQEHEDHQLFKALISTRAVKVLETLQIEELHGLERLVYGVSTRSDADIADICIRRGILVQTTDRIEFSSPVMWRYFVKMRVGDIERALHGPETLQEMIARVVRAINYDSIRKTLGRTLSNDIPLERAWQMEFFKASYRCTPSTCVTSADVGALFGSTGFIDFTVDCGDDFWGIELLREGNKLDEHIGRFAPGGPYSLLQLSDYCLVDLRRVSSMGDTTRATITADLNRCEKLYVVCYDPKLVHVSVLNAHSVWNIF